MMKILKLDLNDNMYNLEINNCIDYNIGQIFSYFDNRYSNLYYAYRTLIVNYSSITNYNEYIYDKIFLKKIIVKIDNVIDDMISLINDDHLVCIEVPNSILFYSPMYKENNIISINHSFIIEGYDSDKKIFFIRDSSINKELIAKFNNSTILSKMQITFSMLMDIYTNLMLKYDGKNSVYYFIEEKNYSSAYLSFINEIKALKFNNDRIVYELNKTIAREYYHEYYLAEQFRRDYLLSYKQFLNFLFPSCDQERAIKEVYYNREKTIDFLSKNAYRKSDIDKNIIHKHIEQILDANQKLLETFFSELLNSTYEYTRIKTFEIEADSTLRDYNLYFNAKNLIYDYKVNDYNRFWISENTKEQHFLKIKCNDFFDKIVIEHPANQKYICKDFNIISKGQTIYKIRDNISLKNIIHLDNPINRFEIIFIKNNENYDDSVRLKHIYLYKKNCALSFYYSSIKDSKLIYELYYTYNNLFDTYSLENINKILMWTFSHLMSKNDMNYLGEANAISILKTAKKSHPSFNCICFSEVFSKLLLAGGYKNRMLYLIPDNPLENGNHVMVEVYVLEYKKWVVYETTGAMCFFGENGVPLSFLELIVFIQHKKHIKIEYLKKFESSKLANTFSFDEEIYFKYLKEITKYVVISKYQTTNTNQQNQKLYAFPIGFDEKRKTIKFKYGIIGIAKVIKESYLLWD